jgi:proteasome assembly chaperone (PAC2) family protein
MQPTPVLCVQVRRFRGKALDQLRLGDVPQLRDPVLVVAFAGWNDAGQAATGAARYLVNAWSAERIGDIDPEEFYNFAEARPHIRLLDGMLREVEWPANQCYVHSSGGPRDFVVLVGVEPHLRWRAFADTVVELISRCGVTLALSLGGLLADVPHTRPVRVTGTSTDEALQERLRDLTFTGSRYEGPTGIVGVLADRFRRLGVPSASLWANVPHYITASANPKATAALLERLDGLFDLHLDLAELQEASGRFEQEISDAVAADADASAYVHSLEEQADAEASTQPPRPLPSGDSIVRELEEFLRRRRPKGDAEDTR